MNILQKLIPLFIILALVGLGAGGYFYWQYQQIKSQEILSQDPQKAADLEKKKLIAEIGKLIELPLGEEPTVATVTDIEKLKDQPFFQKSKNGDKVLIYTNSKKAILFDPISHKVIDVAPINIGSDSAKKTEIKIALKNGTTKSGLTSKIEAEIKKDLPQANIVSKDNAQSSDYEKTLVVVINDSVKEQANEFAKLFKATVSSLPAGENKPDNVDLLIILGKDKTS